MSFDEAVETISFYLGQDKADEVREEFATGDISEQEAEDWAAKLSEPVDHTYTVDPENWQEAEENGVLPDDWWKA